MDLLILLTIALVASVRSKDTFVEDKDASIAEVIGNLERSKTVTVADISTGDANSVIDKFNLGDIQTIADTSDDAFFKDFSL